ncbi:MAG: hypothetical protein A4E56_02446 [Pelotomaculum sp. PtaU1.Bin065]|nr:MAG: hypothetical protein A4E56_02446 [Pelotomaculum sp. PtaU1.Bin065]
MEDARGKRSLKRIDDSEIIGKSIKDIEIIYSKDTSFIKKKHLMLGLMITVLLIFVMGVRIYKLEMSVPPTQNVQNNEGEEYVSFKEQVGEPIEQQSVEQQSIDQQSIDQQSIDQQSVDQQPAGQTPPADEIIYYEIQKGDCFETIATYYYGSESYASELARFNKMKVNSILNIGQIIKVPRETDKLRQ